MNDKHVVVDGSNIATEGRSKPSLAQLDEAVRAFAKENPKARITVVVDATFGHRIDPSERKAFDDAIDNNELVTPPAGSVGRGDAFVLEIASRANSVVVSNDSFQEFHGTHDWLFDEGRLIGGKPVPEVGWIFLPRTPVRGPTSRRAVTEAKRKRRDKQVDRPAPVKAAKAAGARPARAANKTRAANKRGPAKTTPTVAAGPTKRGAAGRNEPQPYNEPLPFIEFVAAHPVGSTVVGEIERFASHGAYVIADGARCYLALRLMGDPPPSSPKDIVSIGDTMTFTVLNIDTPRRGVDLMIHPNAQEETSSVSPDQLPDQTKEARVAVKKAAKKKKAPAKKAAKKKAPARKATKKKAPARKATKKTTKKAAKKKAPAKKAAKKATKKATKKKATKKAAKKTTPAKKR